MKVVKTIFTVLLSLWLFGLLIALPYVVGVKKAILTSDSIADLLIESGISKNIKDTIDKNKDEYINLVEENLQKENGTPADAEKVTEVRQEITDTLNKFNTEENINKVLRGIIDTSFNDKNLKINDVLKTNMDNIIKENNINISPDTQKQINNYIDDITEELNKEISSSMELENGNSKEITNPIPVIISGVKTAEVVLIVTIIVLIAIIILINFKTFTGVTTSAMALLITGGLVLGANSILSSISITQILNQEDYTAKIIEKIVGNMLSSANTVAITYVVIGALAIIGTIIYKQVKKSRQVETL